MSAQKDCVPTSMLLRGVLRLRVLRMRFWSDGCETQGAYKRVMDTGVYLAKQHLADVGTTAGHAQTFHAPTNTVNY